MEPGIDDAAGWRSRLAAVLALGMGALMAGVGVEVVARGRPLERIQVVELVPLQAEVVEGTPVWRTTSSTPQRMGTPCGGAPEVVLVGSSILWGSGLTDEDSPRVQLAGRLADACVTLLGQPAYTFENQRVEVRRHLEAHTPRVVVWEVWANSPRRWSIVGDVAYNLGFQSIGGDALPSPLGLSPSANLWLFAQSAAYRHVVVSGLTSDPRHLPVLSPRFAAAVMRPELSALVDRGVSVILAYMPALDQPFEVTATSRPALYTRIEDQTEGVARGVWVADEMAERSVDVVSARADTCCHYSASGSAVLADILAEAVQPLLAPESSAPVP